MRSIVSISIVTARLLVPASAAAQSPDPAKVDSMAPLDGSQVRVIRRHIDHRHRIDYAEQVARGQFQSQSGDTVRLLVADGSRVRPVAVVLEDGRELQRRVARTSKVWQGLLVGTVAGAALGAAIGAVAIDPCVPQGFLDCLFEPTTQAQAAEMGAVAGAFLGAVLGTFIGVANGSDTWATVPRAAAARVTLAPARGGGWSAGLRFEF